MKQRMNIITFLVFLYAGVVCAVMKPETTHDVAIKKQDDAISVHSVSGLADNPKGHTSVTLKTTRFIFGGE